MVPRVGDRDSSYPVHPFPFHELIQDVHTVTTHLEISDKLNKIKLNVLCILLYAYDIIFIHNIMCTSMPW